MISKISIHKQLPKFVHRDVRAYVGALHYPLVLYTVVSQNQLSKS